MVSARQWVPPHHAGIDPYARLGYLSAEKVPPHTRG